MEDRPTHDGNNQRNDILAEPYKRAFTEEPSDWPAPVEPAPAPTTEAPIDSSTRRHRGLSQQTSQFQTNEQQPRQGPKALIAAEMGSGTDAGFVGDHTDGDVSTLPTVHSVLPRSPAALPPSLSQLSAVGVSTHVAERDTIPIEWRTRDDPQTARRNLLPATRGTMSDDVSGGSQNGDGDSGNDGGNRGSKGNATWVELPPPKNELPIVVRTKAAIS